MQASNNIAVQTDPEYGLIRATAKSKKWMFGLLMIIFSILFWIGLIVVLVLKFIPIIGAFIAPGVVLFVYGVIVLRVNAEATVIFDLRSRILTITKKRNIVKRMICMDKYSQQQFNANQIFYAFQNNVCCYKQLKLNLNTGKIYMLDSIFKGDELVRIAEAINSTVVFNWRLQIQGPNNNTSIIPVVGPQMIAPYMYTDYNTVTASEPALSKEEQEQGYQLVSLCPTKLPVNEILFAKE